MKSKIIEYWGIGINCVVIFIFLAVAIFPFIYNEHLSSLGRFSKTIEIGEQEEIVVKKFQNFQIEYSSSTSVDEGYYSIDLYGEKIPESRIISLYQESIFEDIQFRVLFKDQKVVQMIFISD
ncbi:MAG: hypothetical protein R3E62_10020 [Pseudomonadales bacterium]